MGLAASPAGLAAAGAAVALAGAGRGGAAAGGRLAVAAVSPSNSSVAIGVLTFTPSVPSATNSLETLPSSTASTSMVALSVSISAMMSPGFTCWPSATSHLASLPSSMVGDRAGIRICVGMLVPSFDQAKFRRRPFGLAASNAGGGRFSVVDHRHRLAAGKGGNGKAAHVEHRPGLIALGQHHAGVHAAAPANQAAPAARGELISHEPGALDAEAGTALRIGHGDGAVARAKCALAGPQLEGVRRLARGQGGADRPAVAAALIVVKF